MRGNRPRSAFPAIAALVIAVEVSFSLACRLSSDPSLSTATGGSFAERLLGESRRALSGDLEIEADRYFHRGVRHVERRAFTDFIQRIKDQVQPREHMHLSRARTVEIMPWLRFATRLDPHDVNAYLGAAFWVGQQKGLVQQALSILDEARRNNPRDYRIALQRGQILLHAGDIDGARRAFDAALRLWPGTKGVSARQKRVDLASILNYRGFIYELDGRNDRALACYRASLRLRPESHGLERIIRECERGGRPRAELERTLNMFITQVASPDEHCPYGEHHHGGEGGGPHA